MKSKNTAGLLALFFGSFGVHKFYLGQPQRGIWYLIFCITFIPFIISIVEAFQYFTMSAEAFDEKFNKENSVSSIMIKNPETLEKLYSLKEKGIISEDEYNFQRSKLLK